MQKRINTHFRPSTSPRSRRANAALRGFAEARSDGIIQVSTGGAEHASGAAKDMVLGAISLANHVHLMAEKYNVYIALLRITVKKCKLESYMHPINS